MSDKLIICEESQIGEQSIYSIAVISMLKKLYKRQS